MMTLLQRVVGRALTHVCRCSPVRMCSGVSTLEHNYVPRRAALYVPGNDERKLNKITGLDVDCVILDCEDGVAINRKEEARHTIKKMLEELDFGRSEPILRVNSVDSGLAEDDLNTICEANCLPPTVMLPKVETPAHIDWFAEKLYTAVQQHELVNKINLITYVESALGLLNLRDIFQRAAELSELGATFQLVGVVFGSDDFVADIGASRTKDARELLYARQHIITVAKAFQLQAIDLVHIDYKDTEGLREQSLEGCQMGFTGKQVIHPIQVPIVQEAFTPTTERVEWATELIKAFEQHQESGQGAFTFRGSMIDMPLVLQARNIVEISRTVTLEPENTQNT